MKINLNDKMIFGISVPHKNAKPDFAVYGITEDKNSFLNFAQYLLNSMTAVNELLVIHEKSDCVFKFDLLCNKLNLHKQTPAERSGSKAVTAA